MTDFHAMSDRELQIAIAKLLGYRVEFRLPSPKLRYPKWILIAPDGTPAPFPPLAKDRDPDEFYLWATVGLLTSVDKALMLPSHGAELRIKIAGEKSVCVMETQWFSYFVRHSSDRLARAICEAWADMMEDKGWAQAMEDKAGAQAESASQEAKL